MYLGQEQEKEEEHDSTARSSMKVIKHERARPNPPPSKTLSTRFQKAIEGINPPSPPVAKGKLDGHASMTNPAADDSRDMKDMTMHRDKLVSLVTSRIKTWKTSSKHEKSTSSSTPQENEGCRLLVLHDRM